MTREACHLHRLLTFLDPLLRRPSLVVEPHHRPVGCLQVGHDEPQSREQLSRMKLYFRDHPSRRLPTGRLIEKAFVPHDGFVTGPSYRARQYFLDVSQQAAVRGKPNRMFHSPFFQRFVDLRFGKRGIGSKHHFLPQFLLALDLWQKHFIPVLGTMYVAGPQLRSQTISLPVEQQQRVIAGRLKMPVVSTELLFSVDRGFPCCPYPAPPAGLDPWPPP